MKKMKRLLLVLIFVPGMIQSQVIDRGQSFADRNSSEIQFSNAEFAFLGKDYQDSVIFSEVMHRMHSASRMCSVGAGFGSIANLTLILNVGVLSGDLEPHQGLIGLIGLSTGTTRMFISFFTPKAIREADEMLVATGNIFWDENTVTDARHHLKIATIASQVVPILSLTGIAVVTGSIVALGNGNKGGPALYCTGWAFGLAGLTCSIVASSHMKTAKKILGSSYGNLSMGVGNNGVSLSYNWH